MIKIKIKAGLGNQMFQYALARAIKENTGKDVELDLSFYAPGGVASGDIPRGYELDKFNLKGDLQNGHQKTPKLAILKEKIFRKLFHISPFVFYPKFLNPRRNAYLIGFWQSEKYFQNVAREIGQEFTLKDKIEARADTDPAKKYLIKIEQAKISISLNVRRGDYVENPNTRSYHGLIEKDYFLEGVKYIVEKLKADKNEVKIFIFSDDISWCEKELTDLKESGELIFIPKKISAVDSLYLMSQCQNNVIVNSSFAWWGAWLNSNPNKIVVAPKHWMRAKVNAKDVVPESWVKLENRFY